MLPALLQKQKGFFLTMNLQDRFNQHIKQFPFIQQRDKQLLTVSGGVDSVVLFDLLHNAGYNFVIAHCNFQLRGAESERDEAFVRALAKKYDKEVLVKKFDTEAFATENKLSIQLAARQLRYQWFAAIVNEGGAKDAPPTTRLHYIITAHHANDSIETLLINFFKGTGISGLHGILPVQDKIFRPMLIFKKEEILEYARRNNLLFVEDSSNSSDKYTRNFFRHHLFPLLKEVYPNVEDNLLKNIDRFKEAEMLYKQSVDMHKKKLLEFKGNEVHIPILKLKKIDPLTTVLFEIVKDFGFSSQQVYEVLNLLESETGKYVSSASHRVIKNRSWLIISPKQTTEAANILIEEDDEKVLFDEGEISFSKLVNQSDSKIAADPTIAALDFTTITFPLLLRRRKIGDYFYPLGMKKKKKLSRFLSDQKLSKTEKEKIWVIEMNKKIIWIVGHRIDERFKILPATKEILKIRFKSN